MIVKPNANRMPRISTRREYEKMGKRARVRYTSVTAESSWNVAG